MSNSFIFSDYEEENNIIITPENVNIDKGCQTDGISKDNKSVANIFEKKDISVTTYNIKEPVILDENNIDNAYILNLKNFLITNVPKIIDILNENITINYKQIFQSDTELFLNNNYDISKLYDFNIDINNKEVLSDIILFKKEPYIILIYSITDNLEFDIKYSKLYFCNYINKNIDKDAITINNNIAAYAIHPKKNKCVALGGSSGEIIIVDFESEDKIKFKSEQIDIFNTRAIVSLEWYSCKIDTNLKLALISISADGKLLIWDMSNKLKFPLQLYKLSLNNINYGVKYTKLINLNRGKFYSITSLNSFINYELEKIFIKKSSNIKSKFTSDAISFLDSLDYNVIMDIVSEIEYKHDGTDKPIDLGYLVNTISEYDYNIFKSLNFYKIYDFEAEIVYFDEYNNNGFLLTNTNNLKIFELSNVIL